jgi:hypothetical protein
MATSSAHTPSRSLALYRVRKVGILRNDTAQPGNGERVGVIAFRERAIGSQRLHLPRSGGQFAPIFARRLSGALGTSRYE